ncbi:DUF4307 domain-containing protein [Nocardioides panacis]|uniref:DUF4307 domain-containing protein n=1 Tax=Nocardioides panacis TaxID=2849501 RepID=A0A975SZ06_9ACTN|nr:DUF4307 domain-containing protein [Nocardioides panacis]QWZ08412.1 DUF4307 domain-containing protein [Nocardioides panacis]
MSASASDLSERYGTPSRARRPLLVAGVVALAVVALAWLAWVVMFHARPQVTSQIVGFDIDGQHAAVARYTVVRRDPGVAASCLLRASAEDHSTVGELTVPVPPGPAKVVTLSSTVRTERRATSVDLVGCTSAGQRQAR